MNAKTTNKAIGIQSGENIHNHEIAMTPQSLSTTKIMNRSDGIVILIFRFLFFDIIAIFVLRNSFTFCDKLIGFTFE